MTQTNTDKAFEMTKAAKEQAQSIRENLNRFGYSDILVEARAYNRDLAKPKLLIEVTDSLANLAGMRYYGLAGLFGVNPQDLGFSTQFSKDGKYLGNITSDGIVRAEFDNVRETLAWMIATDLGRQKAVHVDLDAAVKLVTDVVEKYGTSRETFFGEFFQAVKQIFVYEVTSMFGDGWCGAATTLWKVVTKVVTGEKHDGYSFAY